MLIAWFAWTGLMLGVVSLRLMQDIVTRVRVRRRLGAGGSGHGAGQRRHLLRPLFALEQLERLPGSPGDVRQGLRPGQPARRRRAHAGFTVLFALLFLFIYVAVYLVAGRGDET